jgi:hypothetical protein
MDYKKLTHDIFTGNTKDLGGRVSLLYRRSRRAVYALSHGKKESDELLLIPVIINNRNRYSYLVMLIAWLERAGMKNIVILDNDSTYPALLAYYEKCKHKVVKLGRNVGPRALWETPSLKGYTKDYYIYTDPDVVPDAAVGADAIELMYKGLYEHVYLDKIGFSLHINDLPDHFKLKADVIQWEKQFWVNRVDENFFAAPVDTTFAMYAPFAQGGGECKAWRTDSPWSARHMPWYENSLSPTEEDEYYRTHAAPQNSHWTNLTVAK